MKNKFRFSVPKALGEMWRPNRAGRWCAVALFLLGLFMLVTGFLELWMEAGAESRRRPRPAGAVLEAFDQIEITPEERAYLAELGTVFICPDPDWAPFSLADGEGGLRGIAADLMELVGARLGLDWKYVIPRDWDEALDLSRRGKVHALLFLNQTPEREEWLAFTDPLFEDPNVFVTRVEHPYIVNPGTLTGASIVFPSGTSMEEKVRRDFPNLGVQVVPSEREVFLAVNNRDADMTLRSLMIAAYTIRKEGYFNLKIAGQAPDAYTNRLRMGVLRDEPMLRDILNRGVATLTDQDREAVINRHVYIRVERPVDLGLFLRLAGGLAMFLGAFGYWTLRLRALNQALRESEREKSVFLSNLPGMAYRCRFDQDWTMEYVSDGCRDLTGCLSGDLKNNRNISYQQLIHPDDTEEVWKHWQLASRNPKEPVELEYRLRLPGGEEKWVLEHGVFLLGADGRILGIEGILIDVTEKKELELQQKATVGELKRSLSEIRTLRGMIPICASCKKIRDDEGFWSQVDAYVAKHTHAEFSHGICPECMKTLYPEIPEPPGRP